MFLFRSSGPVLAFEREVQKEKKLKSVSSNNFFRSQMIEERIQQQARKYFGRLRIELRIEV